ncbi:MAG: nucleotidyltransferase substrate binding protein [Nitrospirae bacterium]|nr:nucleotidyltransferase substrate binding protein [Nitrospirota bacterium]
MERLEVRYKDAVRAVETLKEIVNEPFSIIVRDAAIQRFEYTFEAFWKFIKEYLKVKEKIISNSPRSCFREIFTISLITEDETVKLLEMTDDRNMTSHTYKEEVSQIIYGKLKLYSQLIEDIMGRLKI